MRSSGAFGFSCAFTALVVLSHQSSCRYHSGLFGLDINMCITYPSDIMVASVQRLVVNHSKSMNRVAYELKVVQCILIVWQTVLISIYIRIACTNAFNRILNT